jgi:hypothetical protein
MGRWKRGVVILAPVIPRKVFGIFKIWGDPRVLMVPLTMKPLTINKTTVFCRYSWGSHPLQYLLPKKTENLVRYSSVWRETFYFLATLGKTAGLKPSRRTRPDAQPIAILWSRTIKHTGRYSYGIPSILSPFHVIQDLSARTEYVDRTKGWVLCDDGWKGIYPLSVTSPLPSLVPVKASLRNKALLSVAEYALFRRSNAGSCWGSNNWSIYSSTSLVYL